MFISWANDISCFKALLDALPSQERAKLDRNIGCISSSRWMGTIITTRKARLYNRHIPDDVLSKEERDGKAWFTKKDE